MSVSIARYIERNATLYADHVAVICEGRKMTWSQMVTRCRAVAGGLNHLGLVKGDRVAFLGLNSEWFFECYFAPSFAGIELVAINYRLSERELVECLVDSQAKVLMVDANFLELARSTIAQSAAEITLILVGDPAPRSGEIAYEALIAEGHEPCTELGEGDDTLVIYYTGGTTGRSKGVMLSHWNIFANSMGSAPQYGFVKHERHLIVGPMFHTAAGSRIYSCALMPGEAVLQPKFTVEGFLSLLETYRVSSTQFVPAMMQAILEHPDFSKYDLSGLRQMTWGASSTSEELLRRIVKAFPQVDLVHGYGATEAAPLITGLGPEYHRANFAELGKMGSVGFPAIHVDVRIFDEQNNEVVRGEIGEIVVRGPNIMKGYLNMPNATADALRDGWYHTGDLGYQDEDGCLWISGRIKDMIITGGENVYPAEVENVLSLHPDVSEVAVIGIPSQQWGEAVHAIVIPIADASASEQELIEYTHRGLAGYKCPKSLEFRSEPFPLSGANKILKTELRKAYWS